MVKLAAAFPPRRSSGLLRVVIGAVITVTLFYYFTLPTTQFPSYLTETKTPPAPIAPPPAQHGDQEQTPIHNDVPAEPSPKPLQNDKPPAPKAQPKRPGSVGKHPIDDLIHTAEDTFDKLMGKRSENVSDAAAAYRERRGRHPPPGFDTWFNFAKERDAVIVEDFFDQIYHDLEPFWALDPAYLRREAAAYEMYITVRDGYANATSDWFWTLIWLDLIQTVDHLLPDMDIALNPMDEPRIITPYEEIEKLVGDAQKAKVMPKPEDVVTGYQKLPPKKDVEKDRKVSKKMWKKTSKSGPDSTAPAPPAPELHKGPPTKNAIVADLTSEPYWALARQGCAPTSPARTEPLLETFDASPAISMRHAEPHLHGGYVANATLARDICHQPDLQGLNGIFIEPLSTSTTKTLFPMFGGSKLSINNEILLPAPMYWKEDERFTGGDDHGGPWAQKIPGVIWRGVATGGRNRVSNWKGFQRHRFVTMNNETEVYAGEHGLWPPVNFALPEAAYGIAAQVAGKLGSWLRSWANVAFTDLMCEPNESDGQCWYTGPYYSIALGLTMAQQFAYKYLPDVDGNSFSGRYLGFLRSTSLPIKATVWREWHDSRLLAWKHFVPMDSRFGDYYGIMEYFLGYPEGGVPGHDVEAARIAAAGKAWAEKVLRREDMQIYTLRLLLEYARVTDERRANMGWVADLLPAETKGAEEQIKKGTKKSGKKGGK